MNERRVVITGMGAVTPLGLDVETTWNNLLAGKSGVTLITSWDASRYDCRFAAQVPGFEPRKYFFNEKDASPGGSLFPASYGLGQGSSASRRP